MSVIQALRCQDIAHQPFAAACSRTAVKNAYNTSGVQRHGEVREYNHMVRCSNSDLDGVWSFRSSVRLELLRALTCTSPT